MKPSRSPAVRRTKYAAKNSIRMPVDLTGFNALIAEMEEDVTAAVRPAAQAGAEVIYRAVMKNVNALGRKSGNLAGAIYQAYSEKESNPQKARYDISWNQRKAPHALLVEYGYIQRYAVNMAEDGKFYTVVRPSMRGKPAPSKRASQAVKDAYYVLRAGGPQQIAAKPFLRPAVAVFPEAEQAVRDRFFQALTFARGA